MLPTKVAVAQLPSENNFFPLIVLRLLFLVKRDFYFVVAVVVSHALP